MSCRVVIVDDASSCSLVRNLVTPPHSLNCFATRDELLVHLDHGGAYDVALVGHPLHGGSGVELMAELKSRAPLAEVLLLTAEPSEETIKAALGAGAFDHLTKPLTHDLVLLKLQQAVAKSELMRSHGRLVERVEYDALHDKLTGLANRSLFLDRLSRAIRRMQRRQGYEFAVLVLDVDRFKNINDSLGHVVGDEFLVDVSSRINRCVRGNDTVARLGGDEFAVLLDDITDILDATRVAERILQELSRPFRLGGRDAYSAASIGIALCARRYGMADELLRDADLAMYRAKTLGKARYQVFDEAMHERAVKLLHLESDLRRAIERQEFVLLYQPIISLESGSITGFEALVRWKSPEHGLVSPAEFIPLAEETGLIVPLGRWVIQTACQQLREWQERFGNRAGLAMSVNISGRQFGQPDLVQAIRDSLDTTAIPPDQLKLEITESVVMADPEFAKSMLMELKSLHVALVIDDFGTGYSSLSYLNYFPIDELKIDRSFVHRMDGNGYDAEIVQTIVSLSRRLEIDVVAEGVETDGQLARLRGMRCNFAQGFLFARPLDTAAAERLISKEPQW